MAKVGIVGVGMVGATCAYGVVQNGLASELVLLDANVKRAEGEAMDLSHAVPFHRPCRIVVGDYANLAGCDVVVITAGAAQRPGETRLDLVGRNVALFEDIVP